MNGDRLFNWLGGFFTVMIVATVVTNGGKAAAVIKAGGEAFSNATRAAMGR